LTCLHACKYFGGLIVGAINGAGKKELLSTGYSPVPGLFEDQPLCPEINEVAAGSFKDHEPPVIKGSGYVVKSLEAALWAFHRSDSFESGCLMAANLGDDSDTTAAVYGQIAGAYYGIHNIPVNWLNKLAKLKFITRLADDLYYAAMAHGD
jgi:hypothetical protein